MHQAMAASANYFCLISLIFLIGMFLQPSNSQKYRTTNSGLLNIAESCKLHLTKNTSVLVEGQPVQFTCSRDQDCEPTETTILWFQNGTALTGGERVTYEGEGRSVSESTLTFVPHRSQLGIQLQCRLYLDNALQTLEENTTMNVLYPPRLVTVHVSSTKCTDTCKVKFITGQPYKFQCQSVDSNPACDFQWTLRGPEVDESRPTSTVRGTHLGGWDAASVLNLKMLPNYSDTELVCSVFYRDNLTVFREIGILLIIDEGSVDLTAMMIAGYSLAILLAGCILVYAAKSFRAHKRGRRASDRSEPDHSLAAQGEGCWSLEESNSNQEHRAGARSFPRDRIAMLNKIGEGSFGVVYKATADGILEEGRQETVAVKMLKACTSGSNDTTDFMRELDVCTTLQKHPHVITMLGSCTDQEPYCLIFEFAPHGSLDKFLKQKKREWTVAESTEGPVSSEQMMKFACQTASGMDYLSSMKIIHRDLATRNILLGEGLTCKVSDFGFSRDVIFEDFYVMSSYGVVPVRWMAIESIMHDIYTTKSDVWSYGVLLWEIITMGSTPYSGSEVKDVIIALQKGRRLPKPPYCSEQLYKVMKECWHTKPSHRPEFHDILGTLESMCAHSSKYLKMAKFTPHY